MHPSREFPSIDVFHVAAVLRNLLLLIVLLAFGAPANSSTLYGVIDRTGRVIVPIKYAQINEDVHNKLEVLTIAGALGLPGRRALLDSRGIPVPNWCNLDDPNLLAEKLRLPNYYKIMDSPYPASIYRHGSLVAIRSDDGEGVCDLSGRIIVPPIYSSLQFAGDDIVIVRKYNRGSSGWTWIAFDHQGHQLAEVPSSVFRQSKQWAKNPGALDSTDPGLVLIKHGSKASIIDFGHGCTIYQKRRLDESASYIDRTGNLLLGPLKGNYAESFSRRELLVRTKNGRLGIVDRRGNVRIPATYDILWPFGSTHYLATKDDRILILNSKGERLCQFPADCSRVQLPEKYAPDALFACALAVPPRPGKAQAEISEGAKWGFCDVRGNVVISAKYSYAQSFRGQYAIARVEGNCGLIDRNGRWIIPALYSQLSFIDNNRLLAGLPPMGFSKNNWDTSSSDRTTEFLNLLRQFDLIGMSDHDLKDLLGAGTPRADVNMIENQIVRCVEYVVRSAPYGTWSAIQFAVNNDSRVKAWRAVTHEYEGPWNFENLEFVEQHRQSYPGILKPKKR
jgi:hypothetical protein